MVQPETRPSGYPSRFAGTPAVVYVGVAAPVAVAVVAAATQPWLPPSDLTRDSQAVAAAYGATSPAYGLLSNLGVIVMAVACGMTLIGWLAARSHEDPIASLLAWTSGLSLAFVLDDLLLLHESTAFGPWAPVGAAAAYAVAFVIFLARYQEQIRARLDGGLLLLALAAFAVSATVDVLASPTQATVLAEDGAKLLGIVAWSVFVGRAAVAAASAPNTAERPSGEPTEHRTPAAAARRQER